MELSTMEEINLEIQVRSHVKSDRARDELEAGFRAWILSGECAKQTILNCVRNAAHNNGSFVWHELSQELHNATKSSFVSINFCLDIADSGGEHCIPVPEDISKVKFVCHFFRLHVETTENGFEEDLPATFHTVLPAQTFDTLWESLIFDTDIKQKLVNYVKASLLFAKHRVNSSVITWNKMILLHGPPGTGKTSLCKALAQKFAIRLQNRYEDFQLIEINSHSLFSKWFSESGKMVLKLFDGIRQYAEDPDHLLFVLIDEVESLAYDRQRANSADPTDAMRVVNALLTQIDSIKRYPNVLILASSNVTNVMDDAFVDRVDLKQFIGLPSPCAVYRILAHCLFELQNCGIVQNQFEASVKQTEDEVRKKVEQLLCLPYPVAVDLIRDSSSSSCTSTPAASTHDRESQEFSVALLRLARRCISLSGRTLRKLPFLAIALYADDEHLPISLNDFFHFLDQTIDKQLEDNKHFRSDFET